MLDCMKQLLMFLTLLLACNAEFGTNARTGSFTVRLPPEFCYQANDGTSFHYRDHCFQTARECSVSEAERDRFEIQHGCRAIYPNWPWRKQEKWKIVLTIYSELANIRLLPRKNQKKESDHLRTFILVVQPQDTHISYKHLGRCGYIIPPRQIHRSRNKDTESPITTVEVIKRLRLHYLNCFPLRDR